MVDDITRKSFILNPGSLGSTEQQSGRRSAAETHTGRNTTAAREEDAVQSELKSAEREAVEGSGLRSFAEAESLAQNLAARILQQGAAGLGVHELDPERVERLVS